MKDEDKVRVRKTRKPLADDQLSFNFYKLENRFICFLKQLSCIKAFAQNTLLNNLKSVLMLTSSWIILCGVLISTWHQII